MSISIDGALKNVITLIDGNVEVGDIVTIQNFTAQKASSGSEIEGVVVSKRAGYVGVQITGAVTLQYSSNIQHGLQALTVNSDNKIDASSSNKRLSIVANINSANKTAQIILI